MSNMVSAAIRKAAVEEEREKRDRVLEPIKTVSSFVSPILSHVIGKKFGDKSNSGFATKDKPNDPKFYTSALPKFSNYVDTVKTFRIKDGGFNVTDSGYRVYEYGILALDWAPTLGGVNPASQLSLTQPIEYVMNDLYAKVRAANAGASNNITKATQMLYVLAVDSIVTHLVQAKRFLRCVKTFMNTNRYSGKALAAASLGVVLTVVEDAANNYSDYVTRLNYIIAQFNSSVNVPNLFSFIEARATMANDVYVDSTSENANFIVYRTGILMVTNDDGVALEQSNLAGNLSVWLDAIEGALGKLLILEPFNIVNGDLLKAFGAENMIQVLPLELGEIQEPIYSEEINDRINNTIVTPLLGSIGVLSTTDGNALYQGDLSKPYIHVTATGASANLDSYKDLVLRKVPLNTDRPIDSVSVEDIISMTRHTVLFNYAGSGTTGNYTNEISYFALGAEIIYSMSLYRIDASTGRMVLYPSVLPNSYNPTYQSLGSVTVYGKDNFEAFPMMIGNASVSQTQVGTTFDVPYFGDASGSRSTIAMKGRNKFYIDGDTLENLHTIALTSEYCLHEVAHTGRDIIRKGKDKVK